MSAATFASSGARARRASSVVDATLAAQVEVARAAAVEAAGPGQVGEHEGVRAEAQRLATHYFASTAPGYVGWRWAVTIARAPRAKTATVCEVALLPSDDAIVAPPWIPWSDRLQPGDIGRHDLLPYVDDDPRLEQGYEETGDADADRLALDELGLGRVRVLSPLGRDEAATRWYTGDRGPVAAAGPEGRSSGRRVRAAPVAQCSTCGFLLLLAGSLRGIFGVCSNEWSPDDGRVVSMDHGCGAHSETDVESTGSDWSVRAPVVDDHGIEVIEPEADDLASPSLADESLADESPDTGPLADPRTEDSADAT